MGFNLTNLLYILLHRGVYQPPAPSLHSVSYFSLTSFLDWLFDPENFSHYPWPLLLVVVCFSNHTKFFIYFKYTHTHTYIHIDISCLFLAENNCCLVASFSPAACLCPLPPACLPCNPRSYCTKNKKKEQLHQLTMKVLCVNLVVVNVTQTKLNRTQLNIKFKLKLKRSTQISTLATNHSQNSPLSTL